MPIGVVLGSLNPQFQLNFNIMKTVIASILATSNDSIRSTQTKINQWRTAGRLVEMEIHTTSTHIVFVITLKKNAK